MSDKQPPLTIMIPLGGVGSRFQKVHLRRNIQLDPPLPNPAPIIAQEGYASPKPFVNVLGKSMILWVIDSLKLRPDDALVIIYDPGFIARKYWEPICSAHKCVSLVELPGPTRGAAETVLLGLRGINRALRSRPVMLVDGDSFYEEDIVSAYAIHRQPTPS